ncbi:MAG: DUF4433 domain-containing protein [Limnochordaceae bacterium]|nr:DUF4433 domain-containing protein [Limnochordaceae bacterium]
MAAEATHPAAVREARTDDAVVVTIGGLLAGLMVYLLELLSTGTQHSLAKRRQGIDRKRRNLVTEHTRGRREQWLGWRSRASMAGVPPMTRDELTELRYIAPIANLASMRRLGLLCHREASRVRHTSVAALEIQHRRAPKRVPGGLMLHEYPDLYINARNPMLYRLRQRHTDLCVLRIGPKVIDIAGTVISDQNAASGHVYFRSAPDGLGYISREVVFAERWTHPQDKIQEWRHKSAMCAEVLVPKRWATCSSRGRRHGLTRSTASA